MTARRRVAQTALICTALAGCLSASAWAQQYRSDVVDKAVTRTPVLDSLNNPATFAANKDGPFTDFFNKNFFPAMTQTDPDSLFNLTRNRDELFKRFILATNNPDVQKYLTALTFKAMAAVVRSAPGNPPQPPYNPSVRLNAVLIINQLDEQYAAPGVAEKPLPDASKALIFITNSVNNPATSNDFPPAVVITALIGLERHALLKQSLSRDTIDAMTAATLKIVTRDEPIHGVTSDEYAWMRLRAAGVLAQLGSIGKDNQVFNGLLQLVNKLELIDDRCEAAAFLGKLTYEGAKVDGAATAEQMLKLTAAVGEIELDRALEFEDKVNGGGLGAGTGVASGRSRPSSSGRTASRESSFSSTETKDIYPRRALVTHLLGLRQGINATKPLLADDGQKKFAEVLAAIDPVIQQASDKDTIELGVADAVRKMSAALSRIAPPAAPTTTTATPPATAAAPAKDTK